MEIQIKRFAFKAEYTIGRLYCNTLYLCDTLEPHSHHLSSAMPLAAIKRCKLRGLVAIPRGKYTVTIRHSPTFHKPMPYLDGVKGFEGVMLHPGNFPTDTRGCILPGWNRRRGMVCNSRSAMAMLMDRICEAKGRGEKVTVSITEGNCAGTYH